jgi:5'(3')-deoxyribonucleotidase
MEAGLTALRLKISPGCTGFPGVGEWKNVGKMAQEHRINPDRVAFDFDGVVADTMTLFLEIAKSDYAIQGIDYDDITCYALSNCLDVDEGVLHEISGRIVNGDYRQPLKIYDGAFDVLKRLAERHPPLLFVTARPTPGPVGEWIRENILADCSRIEVVATGSFEDKTAVLLERKITHFVEDRLETCFIMEEAGIVPVLFRQPWNRHPHRFIEVGSWAELACLIDFSDGDANGNRHME